MENQGRDFDFCAFLKEKKISKNSFAALLRIDKRTLYRAEKKGKLRDKYVQRLNALTPKQIEAKEKWVAYNVAALRTRFGLNKTALARHLKTSSVNIRNWEEVNRIPRAYLRKTKNIERHLEQK